MKKIYTIMLFMIPLLFTAGIANAQCDPGFALVHIELNTDNYPDESSFEIIDSCTGTVLFSFSPSDVNTLYAFDFCAQGSFIFTLYDSYGDGICCSYGNGYYLVVSDGDTLGLGGAFGSSESVNFANQQCPAPPPAPANDLCADAVSISCSGSIDGTTTWSTIDDFGDCGTSITVGGVWYKFSGTGEVVTATTCGGITNYDTKISVFSGSCDSLSCVTGNDDDYSITCSTAFASTVNFCAEAGTDYYILVHGFAKLTGDFTLSLTCGGDLYPGYITGESSVCDGETTVLQVYGATPGASFQWLDGPSGGPYSAISGETSSSYVASIGYYVVEATCGIASATTGEFAVSLTSPPANDNICNAQGLILDSITLFDNTCATVEAGEPSPGEGTSGCESQDGWCPGDSLLQHTVWFTFTAPSSGAVSLRSGFYDWPYDTQLALWKADSCNGTLSLVAANDDSPNAPYGDFWSEILPVYCLDSGRTYYVQIDGFGETQGAGSLLVTTESEQKVIVCHKRPRKKDVTIEISICALAAHLAHGDTEGPCVAGKTDETELADDASVSSFIQAYPNPFNDKTTIEFGTDVASDNVKLEIYNVTGQKLATLFEGSLAEGESKRIEFVPADLSTQMFIYVLKTDSKVNIGKMNMIK